LIDAGTARETMAPWRGRVVVWSATLAIGSATGPAWLVVPLDAVDVLPLPRPRIDPSLPVRASIVIGEARLPTRELAGLRAGDVLVPDALWLDPRTATEGRARLVVARSSRRFEIVLAQNAWRVADATGLPAPRAPRSWTHRKKVSMSGSDTDTQEGLSDVEVELAIELARLEMPVAEVAALAPGAVVTTGRLVGERVAVRAGDRVIAWGELVDVEGEVGVRLTEVAGRS
jgi:type III secretion system YscQ/HrcQ family protein